MRPLLILLSWVLPALLLAYFAGTTGWIVLSAGLGLHVLLDRRQFARLDRWSRHPDIDVGLQGRGAWDQVFSRLYRHEKALRALLAAREQETGMLTAAIHALNDGIVLLDRRDHILFCNSTAEIQLGLSQDSDRGRPLANLVRQPEFLAYLKADNPREALALRPEQDRTRLLSITLIPYADDRRLLQIKDVTQAERVERMRSDFVANVSHELRTPLTVLAGFIETLQEIDPPADERQRYLGMMAEQAGRMQNLVQDLLTLSDIEAAPPPENRRLDIGALLDRLHRDAEALSAGRHRIVVVRDSAHDLYGNEAELLSAFANLVSNAIRYTPDGGQVRIVWSDTAQGSELSVEDDGIGIEAQHLARLTERFYRVDRGRSRASGGTGLGLSIVKHILTRHQASLAVTSTPGQGSRFAAGFPANRTHAGESRAIAAPMP